MPAVLAIQHIECESPGTIADALEAEAISLRIASVYKGQPTPTEMGAAAGLVIPYLQSIGKVVFGRWGGLL